MLYVNGNDDPVEVETESSKSLKIDEKRHKASDAQKTLDTFWPNVQENIKKIKQVDAKNQSLPLARIKKIMKLDENAKMIAAEAPLLFAKACEIFIQELTIRAWVHTEDNKRRTLQRSDIATAISRCDQFDFLIDIVPREDIKPMKKDTEPPKANVITDQVQCYLQLAQQHQQALQVTQQPATATIVNQTLPVTASTGVAGVSVAAPQNILLTANTANTATTSTGAAQPTVVNGIQNPQQQIQIIQQVVTPTGEVTHVPITITANQLNLLRMQMQSNSANSAQPQQVIIPAIQTQQPSIVQVNTTGQQNPTGGIYLTTTQTTTGNDKNVTTTNTFRTN